MFRDGAKQRPGCIIEDLDFPICRRITGAHLPEHLDHHVVGGFVDEGNQHLLTVDQVIPRFILCHRRLGNRPDEIPCQRFRQRIAKCLNIGFVDVTGFRRAHERNRVMPAAQHALAKELLDNLILSG